MNEEFNNLVELFKQLSKEEKKDALIKEFKMLVAVIEKLNKDIENNHEMLMNKELLDINKDNASDEDYLEAYYVYLNMINDGVLHFAEKISNDFYE